MERRETFGPASHSETERPASGLPHSSCQADIFSPETLGTCAIEVQNDQEARLMFRSRLDWINIVDARSSPTNAAWRSLFIQIKHECSDDECSRGCLRYNFGRRIAMAFVAAHSAQIARAAVTRTTYPDFVALNTPASGEFLLVIRPLVVVSAVSHNTVNVARRERRICAIQSDRESVCSVTAV